MKKWIIAVIVAVILAVIVGFIALTQSLPTITKTVQVTLNIQPKVDFTLEVTPTTIDTFVARTEAYLASVTSTNHFVGQVNFAVSGVPAGVVVAFIPGDTLTLGDGESKGVQIEVTIPDDDTLIGTYILTVTASSDTYN